MASVAGQDSREAVEGALRLLVDDKPTPATDRGPKVGATAVPTATARVALDTLCAYPTVEALDAARLDVRGLALAALNWSGESRLTKPVWKAILAAMHGTDQNGHSTYPQALEMISFLAMCSPLVEPDRLARIAARATTTTSAYRPERYLVRPTAQLRQLLAGYGEERREVLMISLWDTAHDGRWWDATTGDPNIARRRRATPDMPQEQRDAIQEQLDAMLAGRDAPTVATFTAAVDQRMVAYSRVAATALAGMAVTTEDERKDLRALAETPGLDADVPVLLSYVTALGPDDRPPSPIAAMLNALRVSIGDMSEAEMPERPDSWEELHPIEAGERFPIPANILALGTHPLPGVPGADVRIIRTSAGLRANADRMGNCTFGYNALAIRGDSFIGHVTWDGGEYNFALRSDRNGGWVLGEVNSRFNRGNVPENLRNALAQAVQAL